MSPYHRFYREIEDLMQGMNLSVPACDLSFVQPLLTCLATKSDWNVSSDGILFPTNLVVSSVSYRGWLVEGLVGLGLVSTY